jgi:hypothetical protein
MRPWTIAAFCAAAALYAAALSAAFYEITSPSWLSWHVALRKAYSIVAFALVAWLLRRAVAEWNGHWPDGGIVAAAALYSAAIEVGQYFCGSQEGLGWNAFDVGCGAAGGVIANRIDRRRTSA